MNLLTKISAFPVYAICFIEVVHDKWCLVKSVEQTENAWLKRAQQIRGCKLTPRVIYINTELVLS